MGSPGGPDAGRRSQTLVEVVRELALGLRARVLPLLGSHAGRSHAGAGSGGDISFAIDSDAERFLAGFLAEHAPEVAFYSEDQGLVTPRSDGGSQAATVLVVDPIDGTRPALAGFESCCASVAAAPFRHDATMGDVEVGCVVEIVSGALFLARRGHGLLEAPPVNLSDTVELRRMFWAHGFRGRPARALVEVLGDMIDTSSVGGATFELGSAAYDMTRVLTGQLDAYVEPGPRLIEERPELREQFERVGGGAVLNNSPYDLAAAVLCLEEGGAVVTDARGRSLAGRPLLGAGAEYQMSVVASASRELHDQILRALDAGMERLAFSRARSGGKSQ